MIVVLKFVFYPSLLSSPFRANVSYYFAANMVRDERFCHIFSFILNHKALSFSLIFQSWTLLFLTISATRDFSFHMDVNMCISLLILFITTKQDWEHFKITGHWMLFHQLFVAITLPGQTRGYADTRVKHFWRLVVFLHIVFTHFIHECVTAGRSGSTRPDPAHASRGEWTQRTRTQTGLSRMLWDWLKWIMFSSPYQQNTAQLQVRI